LETELELATRLSYLSHEQVAEMLERTVPLRRQLYSLRNALRRGTEGPPSGS